MYWGVWMLLYGKPTCKSHDHPPMKLLVQVSQFLHQLRLPCRRHVDCLHVKDVHQNQNSGAISYASAGRHQPRPQHHR